MLCCGSYRSSNELAVLENPRNCPIHDDEILYICLQQNQKCQQNCLLCNQCLLDHQKHQWMPLDQYFNKKFKKSLKTGTSLYGEDVSKLTTKVIKQIKSMQKKVNDKIEQLIIDMTIQMQELAALFPIEGSFGLGGGYNLLNNQNVVQYRVVCQRQKNGDWVKYTQNFFMRMIKESSLMISNFYDDLHSHLSDRDYTTFNKQNSKLLADNFMKKYQGIFSEDTRYFKLSQDQRHVSIRVSNDQRQARYVKASGKPTVLTKNSLNRRHPKVFFQISNFEKTLFVFDKHLVVIGAAIPDKLKTYGYKAAMQPSHGGFGIGSIGRVYHSKLFKYEKADIGFTFGSDDIVSVQIDYEARSIKFQKLTGFFKKNFEMQLDIEDDQMQVLKPFIMFDGEDGAIVRVLQEYETSPAYQRRLKQMKKARKIQNKPQEQ